MAPGCSLPGFSAALLHLPDYTDGTEDGMETATLRPNVDSPIGLMGVSVPLFSMQQSLAVAYRFSYFLAIALSRSTCLLDVRHLYWYHPWPGGSTIRLPGPRKQCIKVKTLPRISTYVS